MEELSVKLEEAEDEFIMNLKNPEVSIQSTSEVKVEIAAVEEIMKVEEIPHIEEAEGILIFPNRNRIVIPMGTEEVKIEDQVLEENESEGFMSLGINSVTS